MKYLITINGDKSSAYHAIGNRDALINAAYDQGALGLSIFEVE